MSSSGPSSWPVLVGESCELRVLSSNDADAWLAGDDEEQQRWFEFPGPASLENVVAAIVRWRRGWAQSGPTRHWGIWCGALAGGVEIRERRDRRASVSYVVFPTYRRLGVASEAIGLATAWALQHLRIDAVVAVIDELNVASIAAARSAGFVLEGQAEPWEYDETGAMLRYVRPAVPPPNVA